MGSEESDNSLDQENIKRVLLPGTIHDRPNVHKRAQTHKQLAKKWKSYFKYDTWPIWLFNFGVKRNIAPQILDLNMNSKNEVNHQIIQVIEKKKLLLTLSDKPLTNN
jgi:hypothetical protein